MMKTISLQLPDPLDAGLNALAEKQGITKPDLIRRALEEYIAKVTETGGLSAFDLAKDLCGSVDDVDLPADLSTNPKYMEDFGK